MLLMASLITFMQAQSYCDPLLNNVITPLLFGEFCSRSMIDACGMDLHALSISPKLHTERIQKACFWKKKTSWR